MSVSARNSLLMLDRCRIMSKQLQDEVCISEPDEYIIEVMCDFGDRINPYDAINDYELYQLLENIFDRQKD